MTIFSRKIFIILSLIAMVMTFVSVILRTNSFNDAYKLFDGRAVVSASSKRYSEADNEPIRSSPKKRSNQETEKKQQQQQQQSKEEKEYNSTTAAQQDLVLPNVLMIGAQKAGTTSVAYWLIRNSCRPRVFSGEPYFFDKEVHFFDDKFDRYKNGISFYSRRFEHCNCKNLILDATPAYLPYAQRVFDTYTDPKAQVGIVNMLKLIVLLREPISRELSWYNHKTVRYTKGGRDSWITDVAHENGTIKTFDDYAADLKDIITNDRTAYGYYVDHLRAWVNLFSRQQLLVLSYRELLEDPQKAQWRIQQFLGTNFTDSFVKSNTKDSTFKVKEISSRARELLEPLFKEKNEELLNFLEHNPGPSMEQRPFPEFLRIGVE